MCSWDAILRISVHGISEGVDTEQLAVKQTVTAHSYMFDSRHALCERVEIVVEELFAVSENGVDDRHGAFNEILGAFCSRSCLLITVVDCELWLVAVSAGTAELADWNVIRTTQTNTQYRSDGSSRPATTTETPGDLADVAFEEIAGVFTSFKYAAEVLHCAAAAGGDLVPADPNDPPTAEADVPPDELRGPLQSVYGSKWRRRRLIRGEREIEDSDGRVIRQGLVEPGAWQPSGGAFTGSTRAFRPVIVRADAAADRAGSPRSIGTEPGAALRHEWGLQKGSQDVRER